MTMSSPQASYMAPSTSKLKKLKKKRKQLTSVGNTTELSTPKNHGKPTKFSYINGVSTNNTGNIYTKNQKLTMNKYFKDGSLAIKDQGEV